MNKNIFFLILAVICIAAIGCGETVSGISKDANRISKGVKTVFIRDSE